MDERSEGRSSFVFCRGFFDAASNLRRSKRLVFYEALIRYALDDVMPDTADPVLLAIFSLVKPTLDSSRRRSEGCARGGRASAGVKKRRHDLPVSVPEYNT